MGFIGDDDDDNSEWEYEYHENETDVSSSSAIRGELCTHKADHDVELLCCPGVERSAESEASSKPES